MSQHSAPHPKPLPEQYRARARIARAISAPGLAGLVVFVVAIVVAVLLVALRPHAPVPDPSANGAGDPATDTTELAAGAGGSSVDDADIGAGAPAGTGDAGEDGAVYVHVVGEVKSPGVFTLPTGSRVADALEAAGGAGPKAELAGVNLARQVVDGEQVLVPNAKQLKAGGGGAAAGTPAPVAPSGGGGAPGAAGAPVNLNTADQAALETLPRVGPALATRIIEWRDANGAFSSVDQLLEVTGIGEKTFAGLRDQVTV